MVKIEINSKEFEVKEGELLLKVLRENGVKIPTLCYMEGLPPSGACRLCVVEIEGMRALVPSCAYPVTQSIKVKTHSPRVLNARKTIIELLLSNHPDDCLYCVRNNNCQLQSLAEELGVTERRFSGEKNNYKTDLSSPSIVRDPSKCILCGRCVRICEEIQGVAAIDFIGRGSKAVVGTAFNQGLNVSSCINCGQCIMVCPTGALTEKSYLKEVIDAIDNPSKMVVVQHAPSVSVTLGEYFGMKTGADVDGIMTSALRQIGFDKVFDTAFAADLTIMEEASELAYRIKNGGKLPMMTSCSPGWIKYVEQFFPDYIENLSSCKSPQQMMGAVIKSYFAQREGIAPENIYSVSIMPCTAKKFEAGRIGMGRDGVSDIDAVLTTREFAQLIKMRGIDMNSLTPESPDTPFGERATSGKLFGATGGVMEAAVRTAHYLLTGKEYEEQKIPALRGLGEIKEAKVMIGDMEVSVAVVSGLLNAAKLLTDIRNGKRNYHFIEVMTCPGGCIAGGGQPLNTDINRVKARMQALYNIDRTEAVKTSHSNKSIQRLYKEFLVEPLSEKSHHLLHTHYEKREVVI